MKIKYLPNHNSSFTLLDAILLIPDLPPFLLELLVVGLGECISVSSGKGLYKKSFFSLI